MALSRFQRRWLRQLLIDDAVVAYPTEGVFGLGCLADAEKGIARIIDLKGRSADKGLILLVGAEHQLAGWAKLGAGLPATGSATAPLTWIVPAGAKASALITGGRTTVAVRVTGQPALRALCLALPAPLISTSANRSGRPSITDRHVLQRQFRGLVDAIVPGPLGGAAGVSEIRDLASGRVLRPAVRQ